mmetsp:Transcript_7427/g.8568  ORF Transcript_7427/g.8568 Transcript_7427/m.8568 type:complete len:314 (+) Transcript_7427:257-1198(+)
MARSESESNLVDVEFGDSRGLLAGPGNVVGKGRRTIMMGIQRLSLKAVLKFTLVVVVAFYLGWLAGSADKRGSLKGTGVTEDMMKVILSNDASLQYVVEWSEGAERQEVARVLQAGAVMSSVWELKQIDDGDGLPDAGLTAVLAFAFGQGMDDTPGGTNEGLAWGIHQLLERYKAEALEAPLVLAQVEVSDALQQLYNIHANFTARPNGTYLTTYGVMDQFSNQLAPNHITQVVVVAHKDHAIRCAKTAEHFNYTVLGTFTSRIPWTQFGCDSNGYDPKSTQAWTRDRAHYLMHELMARPKMMEAGQISFWPN